MIPKSENACTRVRDSGWQNLYSQSMSVTGDYYVSVLLCITVYAMWSCNSGWSQSFMKYRVHSTTMVDLELNRL